MNGEMKLLDLFCGAGGAAMGYYRAGFKDITGVDNRPMPRYPFKFIQADALEYLEAHGHEYDVIHASPPCQAYTTLRGLTKNNYPRLIPQIRRMFQYFQKTYVIENVQGSEIIRPIMLCGSSFDLGVRRHRFFEMSDPPIFVPDCRHDLQPFPIDVTGTGGLSKKPRTAPGGGLSRKPRNLQEAKDAMDIDWMTRAELSQAIPPAYTEWIGKRIMEAMNCKA